MMLSDLYLTNASAHPLDQPLNTCITSTISHLLSHVNWGLVIFVFFALLSDFA